MARKAMVLALVLVACSGAAGDDPERPVVAATTTVLGDIVSNLVGEEADVVVLLPQGADPHDFAPSAADAVRLREAALVVAGGLGLEEGFEDALFLAAEEGVPVLRVGDAVDAVLLPSGAPDPHFWLDPVRTDAGLVALGDALDGLLPGQRERTAGYREAVQTTHAEVASIVAAIPAQRRLLVTGHDALRHFADRYGFEVVGVVVPGGSTSAAPGAGTIAALADEMTARGIDTIFTESGEPSGLVEAVAGEVAGGARVVPLFVGSLGPAGSGAEDYLGLLTTNARLVAEALAG